MAVRPAPANTLRAPSTRPPIPVWVITGALGAGKTTAIARLMAAKPPAENWIVILNEFTESGIDALTVAGSAQGVFDVRLVPGGCLCCAGELDFARQLRELTRGTRPDRLLIEPSGIGHPAAITEELLQHQSYGSLRVESIVCLVEPRRVRELLVSSDSVERAQAEVADTLVLSKADTATDAERASFGELAGGFFPKKSWTGEMTAGQLPAEALSAVSERQAHSVARSDVHEHERHVAAAHAHHEHHDAGVTDAAPAQRLQLGAFTAERSELSAVGRDALAWRIDRSAVFARTRLLASLAAEGDAAPLRSVERFKGVFRTGPETWLLVQRTGSEFSSQETSWRRDSRAEALFLQGAKSEATAIEQALSNALARAES
jgi:G3E family GTPase